ncbi:MAG TPA: SH3 domain-containing protein [Terriglobales bacterium]|nr:SH3 domain-containing protein [Terriglobales bacterium]
MKFSLTFLPQSSALALCLISAIFFSACNRGRGRVLEIAYVSGVQANLRDHVAAVYEKAGVVKNGERVEVLDHDRRFVKVRTATGVTGWVEQRYLVGQDVFDQIQKLTADNRNDPVQAQGTTRNDTNLHVEPGRDTEHLYQISAGEKLSLLKRGTAEKPGAVATPSRSATPGSNPQNNDKKQPVPVIEDWWLVRDSHDRVGWVLGRMIDLDIPLDVAQYAEGQRIVAFFVLNQVQDAGKKVAQYLTVVTEPKDGLPFDFNQIRVFTWNVKRHRYETAYRERMEGVLPVTVAQENFDKEGLLPVFSIRVKDDNGNVTERKYKLNTPIVRRAYRPGEEPVRNVSRKAVSKKAVSRKAKRKL